MKKDRLLSFFLFKSPVVKSLSREEAESNLYPASSSHPIRYYQHRPEKVIQLPPTSFQK